MYRVLALRCWYTAPHIMHVFFLLFFVLCGNCEKNSWSVGRINHLNCNQLFSHLLTVLQYILQIFVFKWSNMVDILGAVCICSLDLIGAFHTSLPYRSMRAHHGTTFLCTPHFRTARRGQNHEPSCCVEACITASQVSSKHSIFNQSDQSAYTTQKMIPKLLVSSVSSLCYVNVLSVDMIWLLCVSHWFGLTLAASFVSWFTLNKL